jgi:hypothetical protein
MNFFIVFVLVFQESLVFSLSSSFPDNAETRQSHTRSILSYNFTGVNAVSLDFAPRTAGITTQLKIEIQLNNCSSCQIDPGETIILFLPGFSRGSDASFDTSQIYDSVLDGKKISRFNISSWIEASSQLILTCTENIPKGSHALIYVPTEAGIKLPNEGLRQNQVFDALE